MPQKRNPDAAELVRGKAGRVIGALTGLLVVMKGLPLAYSKDMQEDKEGAFDALQTLSLCLAAMTGMVRDMTPDAPRMKAAAAPGFATATDLADWLVTRRSACRSARPITSPAASSRRRPSADVGPRRAAAGRRCRRSSRASPRTVFDVLGVEKSVRSRMSYGGTAPANVEAQARLWLGRLKDEASAKAGG